MKMREFDELTQEVNSKLGEGLSNFFWELDVLHFFGIIFIIMVIFTIYISNKEKEEYYY